MEGKVIINRFLLIFLMSILLSCNKGNKTTQIIYLISEAHQKNIIEELPKMEVERPIVIIDKDYVNRLTKLTFIDCQTCSDFRNYIYANSNRFLKLNDKLIPIIIREDYSFVELPYKKNKNLILSVGFDYRYIIDDKNDKRIKN